MVNLLDIPARMDYNGFNHWMEGGEGRAQLKERGA